MRALHGETVVVRESLSVPFFEDRVLKATLLRERADTSSEHSTSSQEAFLFDIAMVVESLHHIRSV
jgi:hypothetical protein